MTFVFMSDDIWLTVKSQPTKLEWRGGASNEKGSAKMASEAWFCTEVLALREEAALLRADLKANPQGKS